MPGMVNRAAECSTLDGKINPQPRSAPKSSELVRRRPDDGLVTVTLSRSGTLASACHPPGDSRFRPRSGKFRDCAHLTAHEGCVWSVTVKDPRRSPSKRHRSHLRMRPRRASPSRTGAARSRFWTFRSTARSAPAAVQLSQPTSQQSALAKATHKARRRTRGAAAEAAARGGAT